MSNSSSRLLIKTVTDRQNEKTNKTTSRGYRHGIRMNPRGLGNRNRTTVTATAISNRHHSHTHLHWSILVWMLIRPAAGMAFRLIMDERDSGSRWSTASISSWYFSSNTRSSSFHLRLRWSGSARVHSNLDVSAVWLGCRFSIRLGSFGSVALLYRSPCSDDVL